MPSETQRIFASIAFELLGFAMPVFTNRLLKLGILCMPKGYAVFYRSIQPTSIIHFVIELTLYTFRAAMVIKTRIFGKKVAKNKSQPSGYVKWEEMGERRV